MIGTIMWFIPRIVTFYFFLVTMLSGAICYFLLQPSLKKQFPTEAKIAKWGGLTYMIGGTILFLVVRLIF